MFLNNVKIVLVSLSWVFKVIQQICEMVKIIEIILVMQTTLSDNFQT